MTTEVEPGGRAPRMLVADDDPSIVRLLADRCSRMGFDVETAANGMQALIKAGRGHFDILVIDVNMPEVDGITVCAHLLEPSRSPLDVIVITGSHDRDTQERCESFGTFYAAKGIDFWNDFEAALIEICPNHALAIRSLARSKAGTFRERPCVLLIDDDEDVQKFLASRLGKYGVELLYASDAIQGHRTACREKPSVIVADYFMPNGDAQYLLSRLRTTAATENIPVVVFSGQELDVFRRQSLMRDICGKQGAAHILAKSTDVSELFAALQEFCGFGGGTALLDRPAKHPLSH